MPCPRWLKDAQIWSAEMDQLFRELVIEPVMVDPDSTSARKLGYTFPEIRQNVIEFGVADFTTTYRQLGRRTLSPDEKVLLYCFTNMRAHFYSSYVNFRSNRLKLNRFFDSAARPMFIDIGCGPATACLALCDTLFRETDIRYCGIDIADAMHTMARSFWNKAVRQGVISAAFQPKFRHSWSEIPPAAIKIRTSVLLNFSFFFASHSLKNANLRELAKFVKGLAANDKVEQVLLSYTNSTKGIATSNYATFKRLLGKEFAQFKPIASEVTYRNQRHGASGDPTPFEREFIELKG